MCLSIASAYRSHPYPVVERLDSGMSSTARDGYWLRRRWAGAVIGTLGALPLARIHREQATCQQRRIDVVFSGIEADRSRQV